MDDDWALSKESEPLKSSDLLAAGQNYLVTYHYKSRKYDNAGYHYSIETSVVEFVDKMEKYKEDGTYILINVLAIDAATAKRWDGSLQGM